jgi:hypothetical protein
MKREKRVDIVNRFGVVSQRAEIETTKGKFEKLVSILMELAKESLAIRQLK